MSGMAIIDVKPDCGNAPRKQFLKDLNIAFINGDEEFLKNNIPEGIELILAGQKTVSGKNNFLTEINSYKNWKAKKLVIETIITHGPDASVSGQIITEDNSLYLFSDIYRFTSAGGAKIGSITRFITPQ
jgi:hypothetical protein